MEGFDNNLKIQTSHANGDNTAEAFVTLIGFLPEDFGDGPCSKKCQFNPQWFNLRVTTFKLKNIFFKAHSVLFFHLLVTLS